MNPPSVFNRLARLAAVWSIAALVVGASAQDRPRGIYSLGTLNSLTTLRTNDFVNGFTIRVRWDQLETAQGVYNFSLISNAIAQLQPAGKKLTVEIFAINPPAYVTAVASGNPATGIAFGYNTYGATYFELYVTDIDNAALQNDLRSWHTTLIGANNTAPSITSVGNQTITAGSSAGPLSFTVGDGETAAAALTVTAGSSNMALLPLANIALGGSGANRTITLTPASGQTGAATVTLTVSDGTLTASTSFTLTVNAAAGFTFTVNSANNTFTYSDAQRSFTGIFVKPAGNGPFGAVVINHGQGGTAASYSLPKANEMSPWGLVCIGPTLTHVAGGETAPETTGNCPENVARGEACLNALASLNYVDPNRLAIFGHSKGAYATIGQVAALTFRLKAAGMSAGGIIPDSGGTGNSAPTTTEATPVRTPFIMFHGNTDPTVSPSFSLSFQSLLTSLVVPNDRILYDVAAYTPNEQHNIHQIPSVNADLLTKLHAWFITQGVLPFSFGSSQGGTMLGAFAGSTVAITLTASGGTGPYAWTLASGSLPAGGDAQYCWSAQWIADLGGLRFIRDRGDRQHRRKHDPELHADLVSATEHAALDA